MKITTSPTTGNTSAVLTAPERTLLARAKSLLVKLAVADDGDLGNAAGDLAEGLGDLIAANGEAQAEQDDPADPTKTETGTMFE